MNDEYLELPCPDTNTYKVGDLVRAYDSDACGDFTCTESTGDHVFLGDGFPRGQWIHFKALRPLKKKEPLKVREFWIGANAQEQYRLLWSIGDKSACDYSFKVHDVCPKCGKDFNK